ncbi:MAG: carboxypeptidase regulatory-like domain-containing protein, partial [Pyrinomonadaceae bacterium]
SISQSITITVVVEITGTVRLAPALTPLAGVTMNLSGCATESTTTGADGEYTFAGIYTGNCTVTPSGQFFDPVNRTVSTATNVSGVDFVKYSSASDIPRTLTFVDQYVAAGEAGSMPVVFNGQDDETMVAFSFSYDINPFAQPPNVVCGPAAPGCTLTLDNSVLGRVGVTIVPAGGVFSRSEGAGPKQIATIDFQTVATNLPSTPLVFVQTPVAPVTTNADGPLLTNYVSGLVVFAQGLEGDVSRPVVGTPGPGDGVVNSVDVVTIRRFVVGLDTPDTTPAPGTRYNEFQRADAAPAVNKGNGQIDATDVIQVRRFAAGLDVPQSAGGPGQPALAAAPAAESNNGRSIAVGSAIASTGSRVSVPVEFAATGGEMAISFTLRYDETRLSVRGVDPGTLPEGSTLTVNAIEPGLVRILIDSAAELAVPADVTALVNVSFDIAGSAPSGDTAVEIADAVISDAKAVVLGSAMSNGTISIAGPNSTGVSVSGRVLTADGRGLRNAAVTLTNANGRTRTVTTGTFGFYRFDGVEPGAEYVVGVSSRRFRFAPRRINVRDSIGDIDFTAQE